MTGAELAAIRKAAGLSQIELAHRVGIGRHTVSYWENRPRVIRHAWAVQRMAEVLPLPDFFTPVCARTGWGVIADLDCNARLAAEIAAWRARHDARQARKRQTCGAKTRKGTPCRSLSEPGKRRCKFHGGKSTGAKTPEGRERIAQAQRRRWAAWRKAKDDAAK
ncbi:MAG: hypothetical protein A2092_18005 [Rhodobacteraceae bacterium GWE1_64_9]|nr:MAG: hypothetical protein A2092_18005 [Rhodobacteraceae bacterium GWE1_64_9]OHC47933.1 MAG: hypothetical protein A2X69_08620 [Rhodobacteraceae bacterium GWF1_65_7]